MNIKYLKSLSMDRLLEVEEDLELYIESRFPKGIENRLDLIQRISILLLTKLAEDGKISPSEISDLFNEGYESKHIFINKGDEND